MTSNTSLQTLEEKSLQEQDALLTEFIEMMKTFVSFDKTQETPYGLVDRMYDLATRIKSLEAEMNAPSSPGLEIPLGNLKLVINNFLENKPGMMMNKQLVLNATSLKVLQNAVRKENETRATMLQMEENWSMLIKKLAEKNTRGFFTLPPRNELQDQ